ncbi:uncharacterized protein LOC134358479 [Mobula hypostoma]|uniref:uncharacterized protein LOC134358479 n=1 Tax=Mobula hypostoma TaxID=723540 RepID=UPI002FC32BD2
MIMAVIQKADETAMDYAERKYRVYEEYSGLDNPGRDDQVFLKMLKEGLSSAHQEVLDLGITVGSTYSAIVSWASEIDRRKGKRNRTVGIVDAAAVMSRRVCSACRQPGHPAKDCWTRYKAVKELICYSCGLSGHGWRQCPKGRGKTQAKVTADTQSLTPSATSMTVDQIKELVTAPLRAEKNVAVGSTASAGDLRMYTTALLGGRQCNMLVDTGASVSITDLPLPTTGQASYIRGVGGKTVKAERSEKQILEIGEYSFQCISVYVQIMRARSLE